MMELEHTFFIQVLFITGVAFGYQSKMEADNLHKVLIPFARCVICLLASQCLDGACVLFYRMVVDRKIPNVRSLIFKEKFKISAVAFISAAGYMFSMGEHVVTGDTIAMMLAAVVVSYLYQKRRKSSISYGAGMACSFSEGYLYQVIPSDGAKFFGLDEQIRAFADRERVVFPVRRLLLVITRSLHCPPNLTEFTDRYRDDPRAAYLEACRSLEDVQRDVAGVRDRVYRNSAYKIMRPRHHTHGRPHDRPHDNPHDNPHEQPPRTRPVYVVAECATPLHTLWKVLQKRFIYESLLDADVEEIVSEFCEMLQRIIRRSPEFRDKCDLVFYDDTDPNENLADVLLNKVRELEPNFENIVRN